MFIDAINTTLNALDAPQNLLLDEENKLRIATKLAADHQIQIAAQEATVVTVSNQVLMERRLEDEQTLRDTAAAGDVSAAADAARSDAADNLARLNDVAAQAATDAIDDAARQTAQIEADAVKAELDRAADTAELERTDAADQVATQKTIDAAAAGNSLEETDAAQLSTTSSGLIIGEPDTSVPAQANQDPQAAFKLLEDDPSS
jgi:flagellin-like hook-associated protein FlgL